MASPTQRNRQSGSGANQTPGPRTPMFAITTAIHCVSIGDPLGVHHRQQPQDTGHRPHGECGGAKAEAIRGVGFRPPLNTSGSTPSPELELDLPVAPGRVSLPPPPLSLSHTRRSLSLLASRSRPSSAAKSLLGLPVAQKKKAASRRPETEQDQGGAGARATRPRVSSKWLAKKKANANAARGFCQQPMSTDPTPPLGGLGVWTPPPPPPSLAQHEESVSPNVRSEVSF
jgi:hypothetical protein